MSALIFPPTDDFILARRKLVLTAGELFRANLSTLVELQQASILRIERMMRRNFPADPPDDIGAAEAE